MPAAYAHITLVNELSEPTRLEKIPDFPEQAIGAVSLHFKFCELGAVSPDYPYLALGDQKAAVWADYMHYEQTVEVIRVGIRHLRTVEEKPRQKGLAWLLGYGAHVATDMAIHPVVKLKVGPYAENKTPHRECEMHQDAYIFPRRMNLGEIGLSEHLTSGIGQCGDPADQDRLDADIEALWRAMLRGAYPEEYSKNPPDLHKWRRGFKLIVDKIAEEGNRLCPLARHVAAGLDLMYPAADQIDMGYIINLRVPGGGTQEYEAIFDRAIQSVGSFWQMIARGVLAGDDGRLAAYRSWNLDIGCEETLVYWS
jgi:hypothetical protein